MFYLDLLYIKVVGSFLNRRPKNGLSGGVNNFLNKSRNYFFRLLSKTVTQMSSFSEHFLHFINPDNCVTSMPQVDPSALDALVDAETLEEANLNVEHAN